MIKALFFDLDGTLLNYPCSIAMGNAVPEVKQIAAHTTKSNDEDGIAYAIDKILNMM